MMTASNFLPSIFSFCSLQKSDFSDVTERTHFLGGQKPNNNFDDILWNWNDGRVCWLHELGIAQNLPPHCIWVPPILTDQGPNFQIRTNFARESKHRADSGQRFNERGREIIVFVLISWFISCRGLTFLVRRPVSYALQSVHHHLTRECGVKISAAGEEGHHQHQQQ